MILKNRSIYSHITNISMLLLFCSGFFFVRCANIMAPTGGPRDTLAPVIVYAEPSFGSTNFTAKRIFIEFNEYIKLKDQQKEFYTSPLMKRKPLLTIKGRGIQIDIRDTLDENTTYALNFGSSISDNNEGNPLNNVRFVFSTGEKIDSLVMSGMTVNGYSKDSVSKAYIYLFPAEMDTIPEYDSLIFFGLPSVVGRSEMNGVFILENLKPIDYKVYSLLDKNGNQTYEPGVDMVGFLDSIVNPSEMPSFNIWYDTTRHYLTANPQLQIRLFSEEQDRRQNLNNPKRPEQHRVEFMFGAANPIIKELVLEGIDSSQIITEYVTKGRDTMNLWLNVDPELLPDTIKGHIAYMKHDSLGVLQLEEEDLSLVWRFIESKEAEKAREKREEAAEEAIAEGLEPEKESNPFRYSVVEGGAKLNPLKHIEIKFNAPIVSIDSSKIRLLRLGEEDKKFLVNFQLEQDTIQMRNWRIKANWTPGEKYSLMIPAGTIRDVKGHENDTLNSEFVVYDPDDFATLIVNIKGETPNMNYIIDLLSANGKLQQQIRYAKRGAHTFKYVEAGKAKIRVVEDLNGDGEWNGGDLVKRIQPEKVEVLMDANGDEEIITRVNWELPFDVNMKDLFAPKTMERMERELMMKERVRLKKKALEDSKNQVHKQGQKVEQERNPAFDGAKGIDRNNSDLGGRSY